MSQQERKMLGQKALENVDKRFSFDLYQKRWVEIIEKVIEENGSGKDRKNYSRWELSEV